MTRAAIGYLALLVILMCGCGHKQEGPAPTHNSPDLQPMGVNAIKLDEQSRSTQAMQAGLDFARAKYGDKLNYAKIKFRKTKIAPQPGVDMAALERKQRDPNYAMWELVIRMAKIPKAEMQVSHEDTEPFAVSDRVFLISNNFKVKEGDPLHIPSFALDR